MEKVKQLLIKAPTTMVITQDEGTVGITDQDGRVRTLYIDGSDEQPEGEEVRTKWEGHRLMSETKVGKSTKVIETYQLEPTTGQLLVDLRLEGGPGGRSLAVHRVYDPAVE